LTSDIGSIARGQDYFILDPRFPLRLYASGYMTTLHFVQDLFIQYAQAGLTDESDRETAISGLLQRMDRSLISKHNYGIFECFMSRLLLWRVSGNVAGSTENTGTEAANTGTVKHRLPSWSWMTHNQIEFFPAEKIKILPKSIKFGSGSELLVPIWHLRDHKVMQRGRQHFLQDNDNHDVGELWFDGQSSATVEDCVVIGLQQGKQGRLQTDDMCFLLLVSKEYDGHYRRTGAGKVKALCLPNIDYERRWFTRLPCRRGTIS
jgi:hypothetical protein